MTAPQHSGKPFAILVVEDDTILRMHALDMVEEAGFIAIEAANADEAIAILEKRSDVVLLLTDVQMPGSMDGIKLAHAVRDRWPPVKIVVVSGNVQLEAEDLPEGAMFFSKPFETDEIISHLQRMVAD